LMTPIENMRWIEPTHRRHNGDADQIESPP
jgi:hypothetical protein